MTLPEFGALHRRYRDYQKQSLYGFRFMATIFAQAFTGNGEISFMDDEGIEEGHTISLDKAEGYYRALAAGKANGST